MADRIPSDHDAVATVRATLGTVGSTSRPRIEVPADAAHEFPDGVVRLVVDGTERHAEIGTALGDDRRVIAGAYDAPRLARDPGDAPNRLLSWVDATDAVSVGGSVLVDVVEDGFKYGVRAPGERVVYEATESPDEGLASIAERLEDG